MTTLNRVAFGLLVAGAAGLGALAFRAAEGRAEKPTDLLAPTDISLFDLDATWRDQSGAELTLQQATRGRVAVVTMLYTNCAVACPRIVADLKRIEGALSADQRKKVTFVVASMDPARDTPERLAMWAADTHLDPAGWSVLTGTDDTVRELAAVLGVRYTVLEDGEIAHSNRIAVLDQEGAPVHRQFGLGDVGGVGETVSAVVATLGAAK